MSFIAPTPTNCMEEKRLGYGYAECGKCGYRHRIADEMTPQNPLFASSPDGVLIHRCDQDPYNWPSNQRNRSKDRISALTAMAEMERWHGVLLKCSIAFPTHSGAPYQIAALGREIEGRANALRKIITDDPESML